MALEIKNYTPLLVRHPTTYTDIPTVTGWGNPAGTCKDGSDTADTWDWYNLNDYIDMRALKQYIEEHENTIRVTVSFDYGTYVRYSGANVASTCPDYFPRTAVKYIRFEVLTQSKSLDEGEVE